MLKKLNRVFPCQVHRFITNENGRLRNSFSAQPGLRVPAILTWLQRLVTIKCCLGNPPHSCPRRLAWPRTSPFHGGNTGSNPVGDAKSYQRFTRKLHLHRDTQKIHALSAASCPQLCFARPSCRARELGCRYPASSLTLNVATTPALLSHPHHCP